MATSLSRKRHRASDASIPSSLTNSNVINAQNQQQDGIFHQPQPRNIKKPHIDIIDLDSESEDYIFNDPKYNIDVDINDDDNDSAVEFVDSIDISSSNDRLNKDHHEPHQHHFLDAYNGFAVDSDEMSMSPDPQSIESKPQSRSRHLSMLLKTVKRKFNHQQNSNSDDVPSDASSYDSMLMDFRPSVSANNYNINKKRTRSLPQLPYSTMSYNPYLNRESISMKIGEIKAFKIPQNTQYTYTNNNNINRKFSFQHDVPYMQRPLLLEEKECDDKDGHYIVKIGSGFANDRFIIKELLGQGTFGKVVRAFDTKANEMVAIKIIKSIPKYREASKIELRVLSMLKKHDPLNEFQCIHLRECFDYRNHICIVTDLLKISLYDFMENNDFAPFPGSHIQAFARQMLRSIAFLHDLNLIHTDLKPENILLLDDSIEQRMGKKVLRDPRIYTIDFGSAIFNDEYHSSVVSTRHYRAPEIILGVGWSFPCDMWSLGCILIELLIGEALFKTHENEQHLAMMQRVIGKQIDIEMVRSCLNLYSNGAKPNSRFDASIVKAFDKSTGCLKFPLKGQSSNSKIVKEVNLLKRIDELVWNKIGYHKKDDKFWKYFIDLVNCMFVWNPNERITARDALNHKWFTQGVNDEGIY